MNRKSQASLPLAAFACASGAAVLLLRVWVYRSAYLRQAVDPTPEEFELATWSSLQALDRALGPALAAGLCAALVTRWAAGRGRSALLAILPAGAALALVAGGVFDAPAWRTRWSPALAPGGPLWLSLAGAGIAILMLAAWRRAPKARSNLACIVISVAALFAGRFLLARHPPVFGRREVIFEFLAHPETWRVQSQLPGSEVQPRVITPSLASTYDAADKNSLWMAPPCSVELEVPEELPPGTFRATAGIDRSLRPLVRRIPGGVAIDFEVLRNGEPVWSTRAQRSVSSSQPWLTDGWIWHRAKEESDDAVDEGVGSRVDGIPVRGGDRITLRTSWAPETSPPSIPASKLLMGFGELRIESRVATERLRPTAEAPNLLLIVQDTLRADHCSAYGYSLETTPFLERLAARGTLFEEAFSAASWTWPSTASILTGLPADAHGVTSNSSCTLDLRIDTVAEVLQRRGYTTAAWSCNPLIVPDRQFDQGFESFHYDNRMRKSEAVVPEILRWLDGYAGARFFLYLHLVDPHRPYAPTSEALEHFGVPDPEQGLDQRIAVAQREGFDSVDESLRDWLRGAYDASIRSGDHCIGSILERLEFLGLTGRTVVLFTADHGEEFLDHGALGHSQSVHRELTHVPLVLAGPGIERGKRVEFPTSNRLVGPTLALLGGVELPGMDRPGTLLDPHEIAPMFATQKGRLGRRGGQHLYGLRDGRWVLHWWKRPDQPSPNAQTLWLYDVERDLAEQDDISESEPKVAKRLVSQLRTRLEAQESWAPKQKVGVGAAGREMLRGIGYLGPDDEEK